MKSIADLVARLLTALIVFAATFSVAYGWDWIWFHAFGIDIGENIKLVVNTGTASFVMGVVWKDLEGI